MPKVAMLGAGAMGRPMATALHEHGIDVTVFDPNVGLAESLQAAGLPTAESAAAAAHGANVLIVMVATVEQAREALFGDGQPLSVVADHACVILMSTLGPDEMRELGAELTEKGLAVLDAPVSGGVTRAAQGELLIMAGGPAETFEKMKPILETMGSVVVHVGNSLGDGQAIKLVNQLLCGTHIAAAAESLALAEALGLDPHRAWDVVRHGAAGSFMLEDRGRRMALSEFVPINSAVRLFTKDLRLVTEAARAAGFTAALATTARSLFDEAETQGLGGHDDSELFLYLRSRIRDRTSDQ